MGNGKQLEGNPITLWWALKLFAMLGVIALALLDAGEFWRARSPLWRWPYLAASFTALIGALLHVVHTLIVRRAAGSTGAPRRLVTGGGLYRWIRHPMYLGDGIALIGFAAMRGDGITWVTALVGAGAIYRQALHEDRLMSINFGEPMAVWRRRTGLLTPRWPAKRRPG
jgi:protein-S-isoprenylcysteine O-methyltransferase Ste14